MPSDDAVTSQKVPGKRWDIIVLVSALKGCEKINPGWFFPAITAVSRNQLDTNLARIWAPEESVQPEVGLVL
ncbi:MAG: hypothetical protein JXA30_00490, partial [Deltaproteobacteria bacterium]|nr:hypothetical protein [Deltaproteobacteria bacterium]